MSTVQSLTLSALSRPIRCQPDWPCSDCRLFRPSLAQICRFPTDKNYRKPRRNQRGSLGFASRALSVPQKSIQRYCQRVWYRRVLRYRTMWKCQMCDLSNRQSPLSNPFPNRYKSARTANHPLRPRTRLSRPQGPETIPTKHGCHDSRNPCTVPRCTLLLPDTRP